MYTVWAVKLAWRASCAESEHVFPQPRSYVVFTQGAGAGKLQPMEHASSVEYVAAGQPQDAVTSLQIGQAHRTRVVHLRGLVGLPHRVCLTAFAPTIAAGRVAWAQRSARVALLDPLCRVQHHAPAPQDTTCRTTTAASTAVLARPATASRSGGCAVSRRLRLGAVLFAWV